MAYISKEEVASIRKELKKAFPKAKFSVRKCDNISVSVTVLKHDIDFSDKKSNHFQVNHYYIDETFNKEQAAFLNKIKEIILTAPTKVTGEEFFDESDIQSDYFHVSYYYDINIGTWEKPYVLSK